MLPIFAPVSALPPETKFGVRVIKVDHAGEHAAVCIYRAQLAVARWRAPQVVPELEHFLSHALRHRAVFAEELRRRGRWRSSLYPLCGVGGWILGLLTGLAGAVAIAATKVAVERVVLAHLEGQLEMLEQDPPAFTAILTIVQDEREPYDRAQLALRQGRFWPRLIPPVVSAATSLVIWSGMKLP